VGSLANLTEVDPKAPVLVGAGQTTDRDSAISPLELMVSAARRSGETPATQKLLAHTQSVAIVDCLSWPVPDPGSLVAEALGLRPAETVRSGRGEPPGWPEQPPASAPTRLLGTDRAASHGVELEAGLLAPVHYYPWFENAVQAASGRGVEEHRRHLAELWHGLARVAESNPHAWTVRTPTALQILDPGPGNRMVAFPYTKLMTANIQVNQGAALLLCSARAAAHDHWFAASRDALHRSPAIAACGRAALNHAGVEIDDIAHLDLYSCFPSAVQIAAAELGVDLADASRPPTVTGGLSFAGGPGSNYVTHAMATTSERLREDPGARGLVTGVGWYMTKHANALLSTSPPLHSYAHLNPQAEVDALPRREIATDAPTEAPIESHTVLYDRDGTPSRSIVSHLLADGRRGLAGGEDEETMHRLISIAGRT